MPATRLCLDAIETWGEIVTRLHDGPIVDGRSAYPFARQTSGDATYRNFHQTLACYACLPSSYMPATSDRGQQNEQEALSQTSMYQHDNQKQYTGSAHHVSARLGRLTLHAGERSNCLPRTKMSIHNRTSGTLRTAKYVPKSEHQCNVKPIRQACTKCENGRL
eukprot:4146674-Pleurochrysis_carterae.AAC.2